MPTLRMKNCSGETIAVDLDDGEKFGSGGFGTVYRLASDPGFVVKRLCLERPVPIGDAQRYVAHICTTRDRLLEIRRNEAERARPSAFILGSIDHIVHRVLSTHWCFEYDGLWLNAVWLRQHEAPGVQLTVLFRSAPPPLEVRSQIAANLISRMRTLRRASLVHLDCVPQNIFVDGEHVTLIDLDGCGIARRSGIAQREIDMWDHAPLTLGRLNAVRPPAWYPQAGLEFGPRAGNYLFAERWVVIDTVIRILSWNRVKGCLSWLPPDRTREITDGYWKILDDVESAVAAGGTIDRLAWTVRYTAVLNGLRARSREFPAFSFLEGRYPRNILQFTGLALAASLDPTRLGAPSDRRPPYDTYRDWLLS